MDDKTTKSLFEEKWIQFYAAQQRQSYLFLSCIILEGWNLSYFTTSSLSGVEAWWKRGIQPLDMVAVPSHFILYGYVSDYTECHTEKVEDYIYQFQNVVKMNKKFWSFFCFVFNQTTKNYAYIWLWIFTLKNTLHPCHTHFWAKFLQPKSTISWSGRDACML